MPLCPHPTTGAPPRPCTEGVLGPRPKQAYFAHDATSEQFTDLPPDLPQAFNTMNLQAPNPTWYMDYGTRTISNSSIVDYLCMQW